MTKIISLLKPDGKIYIGFIDEVYKYDKYGASVPELVQKYFSNTKIYEGLQWIMVANTPK
jgi:hypothetical protein